MVRRTASPASESIGVFFVTAQTQRETTHDTAAPTHDRQHDRSRNFASTGAGIVPGTGCSPVISAAGR